MNETSWWKEVICHMGNSFSLGLARFVFPARSYKVILKSVFLISIHLARRTKITLELFVLTSIYIGFWIYWTRQELIQRLILWFSLFYFVRPYLRCLSTLVIRPKSAILEKWVWTRIQVVVVGLSGGTYRMWGWRWCLEMNM